MPADASLNTGLLVGTNHELVLLEPSSFPGSRIEIQNATSFIREVWGARKNPAAMLPGTDGVFIEPPPYRLVADRGNDAITLRFTRKVCNAQS